MSNITKIKDKETGVIYPIEDSEAREEISDLKSAFDANGSALSNVLNGIDKDFIGTAPSGGSWLKAIVGGFYEGQKFTFTNNGGVSYTFSFRTNDDTLVNSVTVASGATKSLVLTGVPDFMNIWAGANAEINCHITSTARHSEEIASMTTAVNALEGEIVFQPTTIIDLSSTDSVKISEATAFYTYSSSYTRRTINFSDIASSIDEATFDSTNNVLTIAMPVESLLLLDPIANTVTLQKNNWKVPTNYKVLLYRYYASYGGYLFNIASSKSFTSKVFDITSPKEALKAKGYQTFEGCGNFQHYGLNTDGSFMTTQLYRVSNDDPMTFDRNITIRVASSFKWGFIPFVNGVAGSWSGWRNYTSTIEAGTSFVVQIARQTEVTSEIASVNEFVNALTFESETAHSLNYLRNGAKSKLTVPWVSDAHRGYSSPTVVENTLPAYYRAWLNGANWIETDARLSSDNVYVIYHDASVTVGGTTYVIANTSSSVLTNLVLSTDSVYGECKIPTLESVLKLALYTGLYVNLDCKAINPATLAKMVVDCGMSGRTYYANMSTADALAILEVDPNAGFLFNYNQLDTWVNVLTDYNVRRRSYAWSSTVSYEAMENTRKYGFKYLLSEVNSTSAMRYAPDCIEFVATANCNALNRQYLDSLSLL